MSMAMMEFIYFFGSMRYFHFKRLVLNLISISLHIVFSNEQILCGQLFTHVICCYQL